MGVFSFRIRIETNADPCLDKVIYFYLSAKTILFSLLDNRLPVLNKRNTGAGSKIFLRNIKKP